MADVTVAYLHSEHVSHSFMDSMRAMWEYDRAHGDRISGRPLNIRTHAGRLAQSRNYAAKLFLDKLDHDWLMFIDTDMGFEPDAVHRLLEVADPVTVPVVGGLCFALMEDGYDGMSGHRFTIVPTLYRIGTTDQGDASFCYYGDYPDNTLIQVAGTGGAFLLIHRGVLEKLRADLGDHWFDQIYDKQGDIVGEDIAFCGRLLQAGIVPCVHTGVKTTHHKELWISEVDYMQQKITTITLADWPEEVPA
jgi:glycosyltransferase involved in cell wall biosynthesis